MHGAGFAWEACCSVCCSVRMHPPCCCPLLACSQASPEGSDGVSPREPSHAYEGGSLPSIGPSKGPPAHHAHGHSHSHSSLPQATLSHAHSNASQIQPSDLAASMLRSQHDPHADDASVESGVLTGSLGLHRLAGMHMGGHDHTQVCGSAGCGRACVAPFACSAEPAATVLVCPVPTQSDADSTSGLPPLGKSNVSGNQTQVSGVRQGLGRACRAPQAPVAGALILD